MGFRVSVGDEIPIFKCSTCTDKDKDSRNCLNHKGLPEEMRAVFGEYTEFQKDYIEEHKPNKVAPLKNKEDVIRMYECPTSYMTMDTASIMELIYTMENTDNLMYEGGLNNQPYWLVEGINIYKKELGLRWHKEN